jgi:hypothetical protein
MLSVTELELYQRVCELEGISFIECNKDILDLLKLTYSNVIDLRDINRNNVKKVDTNFSLTIDNFKKIEHAYKTLESKSDKTLHIYNEKLNEFEQKIKNLENLESDIEDRFRRHGDIIILNYTISVICLLLTFFKLLF